MQPIGPPPRLTATMKLLLALVMAIGLACLPVRQAAACSCAGFTSIEEAASAAHAVFAGTVVDQQPLATELGRPVAATAPMPPMGQAIYTFAVDGVAKGEVSARAEVLSGGDGASCGMSFGVGERWLIFAYREGDLLGTGICSGNVPLGAGEDPPLPLAAPTAIQAGSDPLEVPWTVLGVLGVVGVVAIVSWLAFRRDPGVAA